MKNESIAYGIAGVAFGLIAGWIIGTQQPSSRTAAPVAQTAAAPAQNAPSQRAAILDEAKVAALKSVAENQPTNAQPRVELANLYFDAERYDDAIAWYQGALKLTPNDVNVSTDLGVCYYYTNQPDKALLQLSHSLSIDPKHTKTLLNIGIVKANLRLDDVDTAAAEALAFRRDGGGTIVDVSPVGIGRDPLALRAIAVQSGVNVVTCTGYYLARSHPATVAGASIEASMTAFAGSPFAPMRGRIVAAIMGPSDESGPSTRILDGPMRA